MSVRRRLYWVAVVCAAALLAGGLVVGIRGYARTAGADGVVRGYFAALARADAPDALAFGDIPAGPHTLLTATVLAEQQRIAPIRNVTVGAVRRSGDAAGVGVRYRLAFPGRPVAVSGTVRLHRANHVWRLDRVAVATELDPGTARQRESIVGAGIPLGSTLMFPGALPVRLDTPYLQLDPDQDSVGLDPLDQTTIDIEVSPAGRSVAIAAVRAKLHRCLAGRADPTCPLPSERFVPGSVRGTLSGDLHDITVELASDPVGTLRVHARATVMGSYERLDFRNRRIAGRGRVDLTVNAVGYAVSPLSLRWTS
ncbi:MAG: hypothetical protein ABR571_05935 [Jatrophihabitans sp.]|uniref:hypothetical protein n=1 Tax=Jatrophihabitans sp. TaxID=1932789 RepID=UPI0039101637